MPTITVQKHDLCKLTQLPDSLPLATLDEKLALVKGELGSRTLDGQSLRAASGVWVADAENYALRIELKDTNRPDLWCVEGIARQLRDHVRGVGAAYPIFTTTPAERTIEVDPLLQSFRPFVGGFLAHSSGIDEAGLLAFIETQETLTRNFGHKRKTVSIGLYDGENIVFPVQYKAVARDGLRFEPLAPAAAPSGTWPSGMAMTPAEILERHPTGREYAWILEGQPYVPMLTDARGEVLSFPPIINSAHLGRVTPGMTALFVEVTGTELDHCLLALNIMATNLVDRGWQIAPVTTHYPYNTPRGRAVTVPHAMALTQQALVSEFRRVLGEPVETADVLAKLRAYGVAVEAHGDQIAATIPSYRQDYLHPVDMIEDYAISRGYETFAPSMAQEFTVGKLDPLTDFEDWGRDLMIGFGFEEAICNILSDAASLRQWMNVPEREPGGYAPFHGGPLVRIANVMNLNYSVLRDWVLPSLLEIEAHSTGALYPHRVFEVGEVAVFDPTQNLGSRTESRLAAIIAAEDATFDSAQSVVYALLGSLGVKFQVNAWSHPSFITGRVGLIREGNGAPLGFLGELAPQVLTGWGGRTPIAALEMSLSAIVGRGF